MFSFAKRLVERLEGAPRNEKPDPYFQDLWKINNGGHGLRVLSVMPHSTAQQLGFEAFFDFIVKVNNHELPMLYPGGSHGSYSINDDGSINYGKNSSGEESMLDYNRMSEELKQLASSPSKTVTFDVWRAKGGITRQITASLANFETDEYSIEGVQKLYTDLFKPLGIIVQMNHLRKATYVWRILNTHKDSPAFQAQLIPYSDYVIGCDSSFPSDENGKGLLLDGGETLFSKTILGYYNHHAAILREDNIPITLYVYNHDYDILRPVTVNLSRSWSKGENRGILGCDVGYGLLHRLPEVIGKFDKGADVIEDTLFDNKETIGYNLHEHDVPSQPEETENKHDPTPATSLMPINPPVGNLAPINPIVSASQLISPPAKSSKKKRHHAPVPMNNLADFMNEELSKSKAKDVLNPTNLSAQQAPPPPPPTKHK